MSIRLFSSRERDFLYRIGIWEDVAVWQEFLSRVQATSGVDQRIVVDTTGPKGTRPGTACVLDQGRVVASMDGSGIRSREEFSRLVAFFREHAL